MKYINDWLPWVSLVVLFIAQKIASYYDFVQKNDPDVAAKIKHIGVIAKWAVADQSRYSDKIGAQKFDDAVAKVVKETGASESIAKGAVQSNYIDLKEREDNQMPEVQPAVLPKVEAPIQVTQPANPTQEGLEPVEDPSATLDDLDPTN